MSSFSQLPPVHPAKLGMRQTAPNGGNRHQTAQLILLYQSRRFSPFGCSALATSLSLLSAGLFSTLISPTLNLPIFGASQKFSSPISDAQPSPLDARPFLW